MIPSSRVFGVLAPWMFLACGSTDERAPPIGDYVGPGGGVNIQPPVATDGGDGGDCVPSHPGPARNNPLEGTIVILDDGTIPMAQDPYLRFDNVMPLDETVQVEVEKPGCGLVVAEPESDGTFSIEGTGVHPVFLRIRPIDSDRLVTTIIPVPPSGASVEYPVLTRNALDLLFAIGNAGSEPDPERAHVVLKMLYTGIPKGNASGVELTEAPAPVTYDGGDATGAYGLAMLLNVQAAPYPGDGALERFVAEYPGRPVVNTALPLAQDSITFQFIGFR